MKKILELAFKDLTRRKGKTIYILLAIMIPVAILTAVVTTLDNADNSLADMASKFGFTFSVQPKNTGVEKFNQLGVITDEYLPIQNMAEIERIVRANGAGRAAFIIAPRLYQKTELYHNGKKIGSIIAGIDFKKERAARPSWGLDSGRWPEAPNEMAAGQSYARSVNLRASDTLEIGGEKFLVTGIILDNNSPEDHMAFLPFRTAARVFNKRQFASVINIQSAALDRNRKFLNAAVEQINGSIPDAAAILPGQLGTMKYVLLKKTLGFLLAMAVATLIVSIFSIFNIITGILYSRTKEIGLFKSAGAARAQLIGFFVFEYFLIGLAGGIMGYISGFGLALALDSYFLGLAGAAKISVLFFAFAVITGILCSLIASFYPTYKISGIKITDTFRTQWEV